MIKIEGESFDPSKIEKPESEIKEAKGEEWVLDEFKEFSLEKEDLENSKEFNELSRGQQYLVLENLRQITLGRVQEEAQVKYREETTEAAFMGKLWKGISKKYQIAKLEKATVEQIKEGGWEVHGQTIEQLSKGMKEMGPEIGKDGTVKYISEKDLGSLASDKEKAIEDFNRVAFEFSRIPYEWSLDSATKEQRKKFREVKDNYEELKETVLFARAQQTNSQEAALFINEKEKIIQFNQFLNNHPEAEKELQKITSKVAWARVFKDVVTERGIYAAAGFLTRSATVSLLGAVGAPLGAAIIGGIRARMRAKETLKEKEKFARMGLKEKEKYFANADKINNKIDTLIKKLYSSSLDAKKQKTILKSLKAAVEYGQGKLDRGLVNFGPQEKRLANQYGLVQELSRGAAYVDYSSLPEEYRERMEKFFKFQKEKISNENKKYLWQQTTKGVIYSAAFATAGYTIRHLWDELFPKEVSLPKETIPEGGKVIRMPIIKEEIAVDKPEVEELKLETRGIKPLEESLKGAKELEPKIEAEAEERMIRDAKIKPLEESLKEAKELDAEAAAIPTEVAKAEAFEIAEKVDIKKGDSIWSVAEKYLKGNKVYDELSKIGDKNTVEALETYNIDRVKDIIVANPHAYGLPEGVDVDKLTIGQLKGINWEKAFADTYPEGKGLTTGLTQEQIDSIVEDNKTSRTFFQKHPDAPRTGGNYEDILKGKGITGEVAEAEVITPEEAVSEKELSPDEKIDSLKKSGVSSEDIGKLKTEDIKALTSEQIKDITEVQEKIDSLKKSGVSSEDIGKLKTEDIKALTSEQIKDITEVKEKVDLLKKAGVSPKDIGKLKTEDIKDLTSSQIKEMADKAKEELLPVAEDQLNKVRLNLIDAYGMTVGESKAIFSETIVNLLKNTPEKLAEAGDRFGPDLKLEHDGLFSFGEYKKYCELANDVRAVGPKPEEMDMTVGEFFARKLSPEFEGVKKKL